MKQVTARRCAKSSNRLAILTAATAATLSLTPFASAAPYAGEVSFNAGVLTYNLSEGADSVTVIVDGVPQVIGAQSQGPQTVNISPSASNYKIVVTKNAGAGYLTRTAANTGTALKVSDDT